MNGGLWRDRLDFAWVDAFNDSVWVYAAQLASEAVRVGFAEVQYDYVRFPDEPEHRLASAVFAGRRPGETKRQGVARNLRLLRDRTRPLGVPFTIDVFGLTTSATGDMGIGQLWEDLVTTADVVLPMVYPSHYARALQPRPAEQRAVQGDPPRDAGRPQAVGAARQDRGDPTLSPGVHARPAASTRRLKFASRSARPRSSASGPGCSGTAQRLRSRDLPASGRLGECVLDERSAGSRGDGLSLPSGG